MPALTDKIKLDFAPDVRERICTDVIRKAKVAIESANDRDEDFLTWARQAEGDPYWANVPPRWLGGCDIEDPITDEHLLEIQASILYILRQQDWYQVSEVDETPEDADAAQSIQELMNDVVTETKLNSHHLYDLVVNATRYSYGVLYLDWEQKLGWEYTPIYRHKTTNAVREAGDQEAEQNPDKWYVTERGEEKLEHEGIACRVPYTGDVYLDPPSAQSFEQAQRILERFEYTETDLLNGITDLGFEEKQVAELLKAGATKATDRTYRSERDEQEGVEGPEDTWEVFLVIGTPPEQISEEGKSKLKESQRRRDYQWMICPSHEICFKFSASKFRKRPYAKFPFRARPGRMIGHSVCSMFGPFQQEGTSAFRFRIDFRDLYMSSPLLVPSTIFEELQRFATHPGAMFPYPVTPPMGADAIKPLPYNPEGYKAAAGDSMYILARADAYFSSDAKGPAQIQDRSATEVMQAASGADEKLDLLLMNMHMGVEDAGEIILSHLQQFAPDVITRRVGPKAVTVTQAMLRKQFRIQATGSSENASPAVKLSRAKLVAELLMHDPVIAAHLQAGNFSGIHAAMVDLYRAAGVRNPDRYIGDEPTPPPNAEYILKAILMVTQQYAQAGDRAATDILQKARQIMMSVQQQQRQQPPQAPGQGQGQGRHGGGGVSTSVKYEDLAPNQQVAMAGRLGLPPPQPMNGNGYGRFVPGGVG